MAQEQVKLQTENAQDIPHDEPHRFLLYGDGGAGKTAQILTLPPPVFVYVFDPNARITLRGHDVSMATFLPQDLTLDVVSLKKDDSGVHKRGPKVMRKSVTTYEEWERDFDVRYDSNFFDHFNSIAVDSVTSFLDLIMDYVLGINGRPGQWPEQDDYGPQMVSFTNAMRTLAALGKTLCCTGHWEVFQDRKTQRIVRQLMMTGRLRTKIPLLFTDIFYLEVDEDEGGKPVYLAHTVKDKEIPIARCSIQGLNHIENVTLDFTGDLARQGLGAILDFERQQLTANKPKGGTTQTKRNTTRK